MVPIGPDVKADLVIYFKADATHDQIEAFSNEVLSTRVNNGSWPRPGISMILRLLPLQGHDGIAVSFFSDATQAQRDEIKKAVLSSQIVYRVLENVAPASVKKLD
jgi:hypothetical protein